MDNSCFYCTKDERLTNLMYEIAELSVSTFFFFKDQTYKGRCIIAYKDHAKELTDIPAEDLPLFAQDMAKAVKAMEAVFKPDKINYAAFGDKLHHLHFHLVPKYEDGPAWGGVFAITPDPKVHLQEDEYQQYISQLRQSLEA
ncbi:HIT family protein [Vibrio sp.]|nr:HIT family protein [Vibrio sp.]